MSKPDKAILLDRDKTLNVDPGYLSDPEAVELLPGVVEGLSLLAASGFRFFVITNQSGIGRGLMGAADVDAVNARLQEKLSAEGIALEKFYICPHKPDDGCDCRKPAPGLVEQFTNEFGRPETIFVVGDRARDLESGAAAQIPGILLNGTDEPAASNEVARVANLIEAAGIILESTFEKNMTNGFTEADGAAFSTFLSELKSQKKTVVLTNGCFDIVHPGHLQYLWQARQLGDFLIVGLNSDQSVSKLKGPSRPINLAADRMLVLLALSFVDAVIIFDEETPISLIEKVKPTIHVKGGDYTKEKLPEYDAVRKAGGDVIILPFRQGYSTTKLIEKLQSS